MFPKSWCYLIFVLIAACKTTASNHVTPMPKIPDPADLTPSVLTAMQKGIYVNGSEIGVGESIEIAPGILTIKFHGESVFSELQEKGPQKDHRQIKTIACIALLPLCPAIMSINTEGNAEVTVRKVICTGATAVEIQPSGTYIAEVLEDEVTYPTLQIREVIPNRQRRTKGVLKCTRTENSVTETSYQRLNPTPNSKLFGSQRASRSGAG